MGTEGGNSESTDLSHHRKNMGGTHLLWEVHQGLNAQEPAGYGGDLTQSSEPSTAAGSVGIAARPLSSASPKFQGGPCVRSTEGLLHLAWSFLNAL